MSVRRLSLPKGLAMDDPQKKPKSLDEQRQKLLEEMQDILEALDRLDMFVAAARLSHAIDALKDEIS